VPWCKCSEHYHVQAVKYAVVSSILVEMARVLLCPLDYADIVDKRISDVDGETKC